MSDLNLYGLYKSEFTLQAIEIAVATSIGVFFAVGWGESIVAQTREIPIIERAFIAFGITFITSVIIKIVIDWVRFNRHKFDIIY